jgi:hypothetical protein
MGMGLSICRSIIEAHGGQVWATATVPQSAIFQFPAYALRDFASYYLRARHPFWKLRGGRGQTANNVLRHGDIDLVEEPLDQVSGSIEMALLGPGLPVCLAHRLWASPTASSCYATMCHAARLACGTCLPDFHPLAGNYFEIFFLGTNGPLALST